MPYSAADVRSREILARILICGLPKAGKSCAAALTSPGPVYIFNTDGKGALDPVMLFGGEFVAEDITDYGSYQRAFIWLKSHLTQFYDPNKGVRGTVIFDNISTFAGSLQEKLKKEFKDGRQMFPELAARLARVMRDLISLPLHVVVLGHLKSGEKLSGEGTKFLSVPGTGGTAISALMQDWIGLEVRNDAGRVKREFLLAPEGSWTVAVRSIKGIKRMPANVSAFLALANNRVPSAEIAEEIEYADTPGELEEEQPVEGEAIEQAVSEEVVEEAVEEEQPPQAEPQPEPEQVQAAVSATKTFKPQAPLQRRSTSKHATNGTTRSR